MTISTEEFVARFHSLDGASIGERRKSLFQLLNCVNQIDSDNIDFGVIHPKSVLEEKFLLETLIRFKRAPELLDILKSENPAFIKRILNKNNGSWFLKAALENFTGEQLVGLLLRHVSFNTKSKILTRIPGYLRDPKVSEDFYEAIERTYSLHLASKLLVSCSPAFILNQLESKRIFLTPRQFSIIARKHPHSIESILETLKRKNGRNMSDYSFTFLVRDDCALFLDLMSKYANCARFGCRTTDRFAHRNKEAILNESRHYYNILHKKQLKKTLKGDFSKLYANLFPPTPAEFKSSSYYFVDVASKVARDIRLLPSTFEKLYGTKLLDNPELVTVQMLELLMPTDLDPERKPAHITEDKWNCYRKTEKSLPYFKKRISLTSDIKSRGALVVCLVYTCKVNAADSAALENVCEYVVSRHRNDHVSVRRSFMAALQQHFRIKRFKANLWVHIQEMMRVFEMNNETWNGSEDFLLAYVHHCLVNNLPIKAHLIEFAKLRTGKWNLFKRTANFEKLCLVTFTEIVQELFPEDDATKIEFSCALQNWNERHPEDEIEVNILELLRRVIQADEYIRDSNVVLSRYLRSKHVDSESKSSLLDAALASDSSRLEQTTLNWLLEKQPTVIQLNLENTIKYVLNHHYRSEFFICLTFWRLCSNYAHLNIPEVSAKICRENLKDELQNGGKIKSQLLALLHLSGTRDFLEFAAEYYPKELRANPNTTEGQTLYAIQESIGACLRHLVPPSRALPVFLAFAKGDYLRIILGSLYSVCGNVNENRLAPFIEEFMGRAVSVRKHTLSLTLRVLDKSKVREVLTRFMEVEKNASVNKFVFKVAFSYFVRCTDDVSWELLKSLFGRIDDGDEEALDVLMTLNKIPAGYFVRYVTFTWDVLEKLRDPDGKIKTRKVELLNSIDSEKITLFPAEFCRKMIRKYFFRTGNDFYMERGVHNFTCNYVSTADSIEEGAKRLKYVVKMMKPRVLKTHDSNSWKSAMETFVREMCDRFYKQAPRNNEILTQFEHELWDNFLAQHETFGEFLFVKFTQIYVAENSTPKQIGGRIAKLCDDLAAVYQILVVEMFAKHLVTFYTILLEPKHKRGEFNYEVLNSIFETGSLPCVMLTVLLLNEFLRISQKVAEKYDGIIGKLKQMTEPIVRLYVHNHLSLE